MIFNLKPNWQKLFINEFRKDYFLNLSAFVRLEYDKYPIYPPSKQIFNALDSCDYDDIKVVILGQDPYHGVGQANGLAFSVNDDIAIPPSLKNIFKEIHNDLQIPVLKSGNLIRWANQGVLLLNTTLTVRQGQAESHQGKGWEQLTDIIISKISENKEHIIFLLWGAHAHNKATLIDQNKHLVLKAAHPSPLSAYRGFFGCKHFSQTNNYLKSIGKEPIDWR
jgi:uracil-DNA glycosylase